MNDCIEKMVCKVLPFAFADALLRFCRCSPLLLLMSPFGFAELFLRFY